MIEENIQNLLKAVSEGNCFGEKITLVGATKTRSPEEINRAIRAGLSDVGENRVQEFVEKYDALLPVRQHFIGRLQTNKVKYLIGKTFLIHSADRLPLIRELSLRSARAHVTTDILLEVNPSGEASKGGFSLEEGMKTLESVLELPALRVKGFMAMLPQTPDRAVLGYLAKKTRALFEEAKHLSGEIEYLSMGMSSDWEICVQNGSNMIRLGAAIFGERDYSKEKRE